jgi:hypothetical protein
MEHSVSKKSNWGKGLTLAIIGFMAAMLGMVYISFRQTNEMIEDNYYERELKYQKIIDAKNELIDYRNFEYISADDKLIHLHLPSEVSNKIESGFFQFIRLDNESMDKKFPISQVNSNSLAISKSDLIHGEYRVKLAWKNDGKDYFYEKDYFVK